MENSHGGQDCSNFRAYVDETCGSSSRSAAEIELQNLSGTSEARTAPLSTGGTLPSEFAPKITSYHRAVGSCQNDVLPDEQLLASAFDMNLTFRNHPIDYSANPCNVVPTNGLYPAGSMKGTPVQSFDPLLLQDESMRPQFGAGHGKAKTDDVTVDQLEQTHMFSPYFGNWPQNYWMNNMGGVASTTYEPPPSHFQQQPFYMDEQYASNFMLQHDMDVQNYSAMQPHYVYPQMQHAAGSNVRSNRQSAVSTSAKGRSTYGHQLALDGAAFQNGNSQLNSFPVTLSTDSSFDSDRFHRLLEAEKFAHPYELNSSLNGILQPSQIPDELSAVKMLMKSAGVNSVRTIKFSPPINGCSGMNRRTNGYGYNYLDVQNDETLHLNGMNSQSISFKSEYDLAIQTAQLNYSSVDDVAGKIYVLAKDQNGCRYLQKLFTEGTKEDVEKVFAGIIDHIGDLMKDPFGNYLVQKLLEECSDDQRMRIICEITRVPGELITVACNMHGTRVVQKLIDTINTPEQVSKVVSAMSPGAMRLMTDTNGNHVAQRCLKKLLPEYKAFLLDVATSCFRELSKDQHGCCIIQKCIEYSNDDQKYNLLCKITSSALSLSEDQYGNYVVQFIVNLRIDWATNKIVNELEGHFGYLSMQKCGSHVVENCLKQAPQLEREKIINELMNDPKLPLIMADPFGNFVIQTALKECKGELHTAFVEVIRPHAPALQNNMYAKRVLSRTYLKHKQYRLGIL
uniref:PUM-HD domain-containing protein n=1 Tax=Leersia perrieri TaxID=77586 RepID=A0A0D9XTI8_9ORYZ